ncbi:cysteine hydrolase [Shewanella cyperi]|uniref:Cysteine hydrolase n=1 Tax=Shewanella cyperi TaxID=2814292 RepID=A0A974XQ31_9GAMM|nr:cysteine hydrolase family protein [Shewanella cyperi]QSX31196.1 cysteine hydrolase [Shewanella cyperi]
MHTKNTALLLIDFQNDYFEGGKYPQHGADSLLPRLRQVISAAKAAQMPIIAIRHLGSAAAPFFNEGSAGAQLHQQLHPAQDAMGWIVDKRHADSFRNTQLADLLQKLKVSRLLLAGMMTQNCITHTALSPWGTGLEMVVLEDLCAAPDPLVHAIAIRALADRVTVSSSQDWFA